VYSLGVTLWELLTLRPMYGLEAGAAPLEVMQRIADYDEPDGLRRHQPRVPRDLEQIVLKCLAKKPARRYASAAELAEDLGRWERGEPTVARPPHSVERLAMWVRRNPAWATAVGTAGLAVILIFATVLVSWRSAVQQAIRQHYDGALATARTDPALGLLKLADVLVEAEAAGMPDLVRQARLRIGALGLEVPVLEQAHPLTSQPEALTMGDDGRLALVDRGGTILFPGPGRGPIRLQGIDRQQSGPSVSPDRRVRRAGRRERGAGVRCQRRGGGLFAPPYGPGRLPRLFP
jgi:hypothetical protein